MNMPNITRVVERRRYSTEAATVLASDVYWDGHTR